MDSNPSNTSVFTTETSSTLDSELSLSSEKTSLTNKIEEKQIFIGDLLIYASCLTLLCVISFARANDSIYRFTNMLTKSFVLSKSNDTVSFNDLGQNDGEDFWKVLQGPIFETIYKTKSRHYGLINDENQILGVAQLRQIRVKNTSCSLKKDFFHQCYDSYSTDNEDHQDRRVVSSMTLTSKAYVFVSSDKTKTRVHEGLLASYAGGGYVQLFDRNSETTKKILDELKTNRWIDRGTRAIFFDTIIFNSNINLFAHVRLLTEYSSSGGSIPSALIRAFELIQYTSPKDYLTLICEILFVLIVLMQIRQLIFIFISTRFRFFSNLRHWIDLISIVSALFAIVYEILVYLSTKRQVETLFKIENDFPQCENLFQLKFNSNFYLGLTLAMNWSKIFNYFHLNQTLLLLHRTMSICLKELLAFALIFFIVLLSFTQFGWIFFGEYLSDWRSFRISTWTLFRTIFGDFNLNVLIEIDSIVGPLFFFTFIYLVYFVLLNMFLSVINAAYSKTISDLSSIQTWKLKGFLCLFSPTKESNDDQNNERNESTLFQKSVDKRSLNISSKLSYDDFLHLSIQLDQIDKRLTNSIDELERILSAL